MSWSTSRTVEVHGLEVQITVVEKSFNEGAVTEAAEMAPVVLNMRLTDVHTAGRRVLSDALVDFKAHVELPEPDRRSSTEKAADRIAAGVGSIDDYNLTGIRMPVGVGGATPEWS